MITKENYELYFIKFLEGTLSKEEMVSVEIFLKENPELREELTLFEEPLSVDTSSKNTIDFTFLKKTTLIDESNEDDFFIGYLEGDLNPEEEKNLQTYLNQNPAKKEVLESFRKVMLTPEIISFPDKEELKKKSSNILITEANEDNFFIGHFEGDLSSSEEKQLEIYLKEGAAKQEKFESYKKTFLIPELLTYPNKKGLKKKAKTPILYLFTPMAAAAAILFFVWINIQTTADVRQVAEVNTDWNFTIPVVKNEVNTESEDKVENTIVSENIKKALASRGNTNTAQIKNNTKRNGINLDRIDHKMDLPVESKNGINSEFELVETKKVQPEITQAKSVTPLEFVKEKSQEIAKEKTGEEINTSNDLLAFATKKAKENLVPDFIEVETEEVNNQKYRTIKIGKNFSFKRKIKS